MIGLRNHRRYPYEPVRIGVIGVGPHGQMLLKILLASDSDIAISAICDIDHARLRAASEIVRAARGAEPAGYSAGEYDYRKLCERSDIDGVLIAASVPWLTTLAIDALRAGKHAPLEVSDIGPVCRADIVSAVRGLASSP